MRRPELRPRRWRLCSAIDADCAATLAYGNAGDGTVAGLDGRTDLVSNGVAFVLALTTGVTASLFNDFGPRHEIADATG